MARPIRGAGITAVAAGLCVVLVVAVGYVLVRFTDVRVPFVSDTCRAYSVHGVATLIPEQLAHAATIAAVGITRNVEQRGITVALATALQESKLRNLSHGDRDSVGLFQQRPSQGWGTARQLQDPHYASNEFFTGLQQVRGWQQMSITEAAQAVQRSAHPAAYAKWESDARTLASAFSGDQSQAVTCRLRENGDRVESAPAKLRASLARDYDELELRTAPGPLPTLTLELGSAGSIDSPGEVAGWRAAHWLVAKSRKYGLRQVAFGGAVWSASSGTWETDDSTTAQQLIIRLGA